MLRLLLLRHAKSSWADPGLDDLDRPLTRRGTEAARIMGRRIATLGLEPELVLCSPARRARDTWKIVAEQFRSAPRSLIEESVYDFGNGDRLLSAIRAAGSDAQTLMLVGHNPSIERLAQRLAGSGEAKLRQRLERKYPTAALAVLHFGSAAWSGIADGQGELVHFIRPKDVAARA